MISRARIVASRPAPVDFVSAQIGPAVVTLMPGSRKQIRITAPYDPQLIALARRRSWSWDRENRRWLGLYEDSPRIQQLYRAVAEAA
ncbi:hypothetical protein FB385_3124 [Paramicrobacterium agarici]|nr:hypothetical protein FB385_3124 [Microbacterium agarici]